MYDENCYYDDPVISITDADAGGESIGEGGAGNFPSGHVVPNCSFIDGNNNILEDNLIKMSPFSLEQLSNHHPNPNKEGVTAPAMDFELEDVFHDQITMPQNSLDQQQPQPYDHNLHQDPAGGQQIDLQYFNSTNNTPFNNFSYTQPPTPDLLNLFHLPRYSMLSNKKTARNFATSLDFLGEIPATTTTTGTGGNVLYETLPIHLDLPPQQTPIFKDLFHSMPHNYGLGGTRSGSASFFGGMDERDQGGGMYLGGDGSQYELDFSRDMSGIAKGAEGKGPRQHFATERQRREQLNDKYKALRLLVPNPTKGDRASIVHDAIEYIKELLRTVDELKILVDKKRYGRERSKRLKTEDEVDGDDMESSTIKPLVSSVTDRELSNGTTRSTWLQRKSKDTEVDVRIIEDEVTIKLTQRKKLNCLLSVSKILDDLQLGLLHVSGGNIGDHYSFLFNTKIYEGSSVYAHAIAKKLIEAVDKNYAAFQPGGF